MKCSFQINWIWKNNFISIQKSRIEISVKKKNAVKVEISGQVLSPQI